MAIMASKSFVSAAVSFEGHIRRTSRTLRAKSPARSNSNYDEPDSP